MDHKRKSKLRSVVKVTIAHATVTTWNSRWDTSCVSEWYADIDLCTAYIHVHGKEYSRVEPRTKGKQNQKPDDHHHTLAMLWEELNKMWLFVKALIVIILVQTATVCKRSKVSGCLPTVPVVVIFVHLVAVVLSNSCRSIPCTPGKQQTSVFLDGW